MEDVRAALGVEAGVEDGFEHCCCVLPFGWCGVGLSFSCVVYWRDRVDGASCWAGCHIVAKGSVCGRICSWLKDVRLDVLFRTFM